MNEEQNACSELWMNEGQCDYKRQLAYRRLGIRPEDVKPTPFFAINLRRIARVINQGARKDDPALSRKHPLDYLGFSEDPEAQKVLEKFRSVPASYRRLLPPEAFCHAAGVSPSYILEVIAVVAVRWGVQASTIVAAIWHPRVVMKTIERALGDNGYKDSVILHKATGFLPSTGLPSNFQRLLR